MSDTWLVLLPPLIVLGFALFSRNIIISLILGIVSSAFIATDFSILGTTTKTVLQTWETISEPDNIALYGFLICMGIVVALLSSSGAAQAFGNVITRRLTNARSAESASIFLSLWLFIDDYLNSLTVGYVMHPLTDRFGIPRAKLAFLIDSMTAPLCIIVPLSSWMAWVVRQLEVSGISLDAAENPIILADPFYVYLKTIPYIFYSFMIIGAAWFIVSRKISFGPMADHEMIAAQTGNLFGGKKPLAHAVSQSTAPGAGSLSDFIIPMVTLVLSTIMLVLYTGNHATFGGPHGIIAALRHTNIFYVLFAASALTVAVSTTLLLLHRKITAANLWNIYSQGFMLMLMPILTVLFAATFADVLRNDLHTGHYLAHLLVGHFNLAFLPFVLYITSVIMAITTGSSWGTLAIMPPIVVPLVLSLLGLDTPTTLEHLCLLFPCLGAVFSGCVAGDHVSPISDTTIMAATSSGAYVHDHVVTQFPYGFVVIVSTAIAYLVTGIVGCAYPWVSIVLSLGIGFALSFGTLALINRWQKRNA